MGSCSPAMNPYECNGYRLPTETEWEYAVRAGTTTAFYNGDITHEGCEIDWNLSQIGWYCGNSDFTTHPVKKKDKNWWGLYDMNGNVWEWCHDAYFLYKPKNEVDPYQNGALDDKRVTRGGSWVNEAYYCRSAKRSEMPPDARDKTVGFRPVVAPK